MNGVNEVDAERRLTRLESQGNDIVKDLEEIKSSVKDLTQTLAKRPSWAVTTFIAVSLSLNAALMTYALNHAHALPH